MVIRRLSILAALAFFGFILWVIGMANGAQKSVFFDFVASFPLGDKVGHVGLFGTLTFLVTVALNYKAVSLSGRRVYLGVVLVWLFVTAEELSQGLIPSRTMDIGDYLADMVGIGGAALCCYLLNKRRRMRSHERPIFSKERRG